MEKTRKNKGKKGITLIALVITIIVLLILAGISISMLVGDNSILKRAGDARDKTATKSLKEETQTVMLTRQINTSTGVENKNLKDDIENGISGVTVEEIEGYTDVYYIKKGNTYVTVYEDGDIQEEKAEIWDGKKVSLPEFKKENEIWNWYIYTPAQFKFLADFVNNGNSLTGTVDLTSYVTEAGYNPDDVSINSSTDVHLMENLDMGAREGTGDTIEQKWETDANKKLKWTPIGSEIVYSDTGKAFMGNMFKGNNYTIRGVYVNEANSENGMAGIFSGNTSRVSDLTVKDSYIKGKRIVGGIAALARYKFKNCKNINSTVIATDETSGGIVGVAWKTIEECINTGNVISENNTAGGIVGQRNSSPAQVSNCKNSGSVIVKSLNGYDVGGIVGGIYNMSPEIKGCSNEGKIKGALYTGGILGRAMPDATPTITECINTAEIEGKKHTVGGVVGQAENITITNCRNNGKVLAQGKGRCGGIIGYIAISGTLTGCTNNGNIFGKRDVDGIIGDGKSLCTITDCINNGKINIVN